MPAVCIYMHAWLPVQMLLQMHGDAQQSVHKHFFKSECSQVFVHRLVGIARDRALRT